MSWNEIFDVYEVISEEQAMQLNDKEGRHLPPIMPQGYRLFATPRDNEPVHYYVGDVGYHTFDVLSDSSFAKHDNRFRGLLRNLIDEVVVLNQDEHNQEGAIVLDIAGGQRSRAAQEAARLYDPYLGQAWSGSRPTVTAINVDLTPVRQSNMPYNAGAIQAEPSAIPIADESVDFVFSRHLLEQYDTCDKDNPIDELEIKILAEITRTLRQGRIAVLSDTYYSNLIAEHGMDHPRVQQLLEILGDGVTLEIKQGGLFLGLGDRIAKYFDPKYFHPGYFLIIKKGEIDSRLQVAIDRVPLVLPPHRTK